MLKFHNVDVFGPVLMITLKASRSWRSKGSYLRCFPIRSVYSQTEMSLNVTGVDVPYERSTNILSTSSFHKKNLQSPLYKTQQL
ncbi:hypothetical protein HanRHA438_Chr04g0195481 [Helianthus annuus]|nr:hypothetical protein HanRHA438_Chr04g0195481 [Helianthus annuus]